MYALLLILFAPARAALPVLDTWRPDPESPAGTLDGLSVERTGSGAVLIGGELGGLSWVASSDAAIRTRASLTAAGDVHLGGGFRLDVAVPFVVLDVGEDPLDGGELAGGGLGGVRLRARYARWVGDAFAIGVAARVESDTTELGLDEVGVSAAPEVDVAVSTPALWAGLAAAFDTAGRLDGRVGVGVNLSRAVCLSGELATFGPMDALGQDPEARIGLEARGSLRIGLSPLSDLRPGVEVGGAAGLRGAAGIPEERAWLAFRLQGVRHPTAVPVPAASTESPDPLESRAPTVRIVESPPATEVAVGDPGPVVPQAPDAAAEARSASTAAVRPGGWTGTTGAGPALPQPLQLRFGFTGAALAADGQAQADALAGTLLDAPSLRIRLEVHVEARVGVDDFAESQARAEALVAALEARGVGRERLEALGFGAGGYGRDVVDVVVIP